MTAAIEKQLQSCEGFLKDLRPLLTSLQCRAGQDPPNPA